MTLRTSGSCGNRRCCRAHPLRCSPTCRQTSRARLSSFYVEAPKKNKVAFDGLTDGKIENFALVPWGLRPICKMNLWLDKQRKRKGL